jgi:eukaryotic-like serine/threonine-protein kinase
MEHSTFGRYKILGMLGEGGMAKVYLAEDPVLHRCVALKVMREGVAVRLDWIQRFHSEASNVARLGNPHIVQVHDMGNQEGLEFIVMEFQDRGSIEGLCTRNGGQLDPLCAASIAVQSAEGLRAAHAAGVIHRDVKPDNLLISRQGIVKVADFGIARLQGDVSLTQAGTAMGSPLYMSPEQVEGATLSGKSDVYSLASSIYRMAVGHPPVEAEHVHGIMWRIASQDAPEIRAANSAIPKGLSDLVKRMHLRAVDKRPTMEEAAHDLRQWLATQGILDPAEHLRNALGFPQASTLKPTTGSYAATGTQASRSTATSLIADALGWFKQKFAKAS